MHSGPRKYAAAVLVSAFAVALPSQVALGTRKFRPAGTPMDERKRAEHALNRLTFGPRPGDLESVMQLGVDKWIDGQLHPEKIDDHALDARLAPYRTLRMDTREMAENFPPPQVIKAIAQGKQAIPSDPMRRAVYESQVERLREKQENKAGQANVQEEQADRNSNPRVTAAPPASRREDRLTADAQFEDLLDLPPDQRMKAILKMSPEDQRALATSLRGPQREPLIEGMAPQQREALEAMNNPQAVVNDELLSGKVLRAAYSERQLQEVMTDFWFNHFNVFIGKGADRYLITSYERDVIRPNALGKFEALLKATAQSPAMLFYLDNWLSVGPNSDAANGIPGNANKNFRRAHRQRNPSTRQAKGKRNGLNENYGRELMELHTLGVNGGYTQKDVTEVARVFTGWTLKQPRQGGGFSFEARMHEPGDKMVLGHRLKSNGEKEGMEVLHILAHHPSTAKFVCTKLAIRFVSDNPPPALVDRMAQAFLKKDGDIREVLTTMLKSPEFWSDEAYRAKVKTPLEFAVSALRASGAEVTNPLPIARQLQNMGMPLYGMQPPTGYSNRADAWVNSAALLGRMNFALALTAGKMKGIQVDPTQMLGDENASPDAEQNLIALENRLLAGNVSRQTHDTIRARLADPGVSQRKLDDPARSPNVAVIGGLLLGSPEFQRK
ncbi:MAG TPA: DUF1800 domain-containing protein [Terriglobales bacterium]|nr:DUF1800 domain-containing protein [Terriglobales bacterium]